MHISITRFGGCDLNGLLPRGWVGGCCLAVLPLSDSYQVADNGITCDELISLMMPLNLLRLGNNDFRTNRCGRSAAIVQPELREKMKTVLDGMSLTPGDHA